MPANHDIVIIGAGAAGLTAAIFAAETNNNLSIVLLDGARTIGSKILVSGGGRCNVTNAYVTPSDFHAPASVILRILQRFDERATVKWFESLDVQLKEEPTGKLFPTSNKARTVLNALMHRCQELGIQIHTNHRVQSITPTNTGFCLQSTEGKLTAQQVIMATGGKSLPKSGSDGQGWSMAKNLGHSVSPPFPALVPLVLADTFIHTSLSGISHQAQLLTRVNGKVVDRRVGSLLWTHFGISGPVVLDASRFWIMANEHKQDVRVFLSCLPQKTTKEVDDWLALASQHSGRKTVGSILGQQLPSRLVEALCELAIAQDKRTSPKPINGNIADNLACTALNQLPYLTRKALTQIFTNLPVPVIGHRGWNFAEVTAGGVPLGEINPRTMMSRLIPGLYLIGEMLDCDARIGGFNFQWAWSTGFIAGYSASKNQNTTK
ncbi:NAD(P)/FAD-dependent oxidoreductase [Candidatus Nitronereus thalassa]|uniref:NAD(P)/FAD-dependent oxidoreductase n=1 Tax=Candidatus Nitronereus thalassa TaxID=3020898 RepID=A0ABU3K415_9BACT|nr:NAD(P)/FAD-dependent oxidoreductase [Candidatus Nitronereus thalassa]MDT7041126.1 NAD(P)/FAD-dependent oxidoreductase [Candidatus Nitronereus thalassa]